MVEHSKPRLRDYYNREAGKLRKICYGLAFCQWDHYPTYSFDEKKVMLVRKVLERRQGFGNASGVGDRPALVIVDFVNGFADPASFGGGNIREAIAETQRLLGFARSASWPIAFTRVVFADDAMVVDLIAMKRYAAPGEIPHVDVRVEPSDGLGVAALPEALPLFRRALSGRESVTMKGAVID